MKRLLFASLLSATACSSAAYADRIAVPAAAGPRTALAIAPAKIRAPYDVQVVREDGETAPTYALKDRFYVQGNMGERYTIRVTNPTPNRVEAVVSVDGLDVVDGDAGDLRKRGYIVPAYGEVKIDGFRTSLDDVATFRFSSVDGSYAGQKGKARNVGVIAVAIFEEQAPPVEQQLVVPPPPVDRPYDWRDDLDAPRGGYTKNDKAAPTHAAKPTRTAAAEKKAAPPRAADTSTSVGGGRAGYGAPSGAPATAAKAPRERFEGADDDEGGYEQAQTTPKTGRQGLGTEFGEQRYSSATYTRFVRAAGRPVAIAELRYNDAAGLTALGIPVQPMPDEGELMTRETADPFPGDRHFARAAR